MTDSLPAAVLVPLALGVASFAIPERGARALALPGWLMASACAFTAAAYSVSGGLRYSLGGWPAPLGIELSIDGLSAGFLALCAAVYAGVLPYAMSYFPRGTREAAFFWPLAWFVWAALNAVFLSADLFNLYVALELLGLGATGLAALSGKPPAVASALRYLLAALFASNLLLLGIGLLYGATGVLALDALAARLVPSAPVAIALGALIAALALKGALVPIHFWLPPAHGAAATPVSALLSALVIKAAFYILLRLWLAFAQPAALPAAGALLGALGALAVLWGSAAALVQTRLKMLVAYSTVAQVGYLFMPFAMLVPGTQASVPALESGVLQALAHGVAKAGMFLAAGTLILAAGRDDRAALHGAATREPLAVFAFVLAGTSLIGLPPSAGFAAKWQLLRAALEAGQWVWVIVVLVGGLLSSAYVFQVLRLAFLVAPEPVEVRPLPRSLAACAFVLGLASAVGGLATSALLGFLDCRGLIARWWQ
jgi:formate hydrogenlyase subunit 3/multisubunit Na+/H+ antiporter MnhD subunit